MHLESRLTLNVSLITIIGIVMLVAATSGSATALTADKPDSFRSLGTGRPEPSLRGDFRPVQPSLMTLMDCAGEAERLAREAPKSRPVSSGARAQSMQECEATNARWRKLNEEELVRVRAQNAALEVDAEKARVRLHGEKAAFEAEEAAVAKIVAGWLPAVDAGYRPDGLALLADNAHTLVGNVVAGPFRLVERQSAQTAIAAYGNAYVRIEGLPAQLALFSSRPFVMIGKVTGVMNLTEPFKRNGVASITWLAGGDCAIDVQSAARTGLGCLPWQGLRRALPK